ncbi:MAG: phasin family protein, partial [Rhizobacter sp.]
MVTKAKPSAKKTATAASRTATPDKPNLLRAGLQALDKARNDVAERQSRVFEAILGLEPAQGLSNLVGREVPGAKAAAEALGLRKFEAVFDQRVAHALERMGQPPAGVLQALVDEVAALKKEVRSLKAAA